MGIQCRGAMKLAHLLCKSSMACATGLVDQLNLSPQQTHLLSRWLECVNTPRSSESVLAGQSVVDPDQVGRLLSLSD